MKKKLSLLMVALVAIAAFATTMSLTNARRVVSELAVVSEATTWDFSTDVTLASTYSGDFKADDKTVENIYANFDVLTFGENFKADALAFTGEYPFRSNSKKFAQNGTLHFKTSVAGKIVVKFSDTGSSASATAVKRYLVVNGTQTDYWASRENNGDEGYPAQLNVTTDEIEVPAGDVTIAGSSAIVVSYVSWAPNATPEPAGGETTWEVASSIAADDVVVLAYADGDTKKELKAIEMYGSNSVGAVDDYTGDKPAAVYPLTVVAGSADGSVAFKTTENKYLAWSSGNTLTAIDEVNANSSWTVTFTESVPTIVNVSDTNRKLQYNASNPRFCAYTSNQKALTIWKQVEDQPAGPTTLINYPTSQEGITIGGTTTFDKVRIHENTDEVSGIKFANGYTSSGVVNDNKALLEVEGGFKAGDKITIAGAFNNSDDTKVSKIDIFTMDAENKPTVLFTTQQFVNGRTSAGDPAAEEFTLTADVDKLYLGRNGGTGTFVTLLTITRPGEEPQPAEGEIVISPASGDIATALAEATEGKEVKSITINLTKDVTYTVSKALVTPADFTINGNGATIDASALETNLIQMAAVESPTEWTKADVTISGVTVKGLKKALFYSTNKKYIAENFTIDNCVVELAADATTIDYTKGSTAKNITVTNSTFYAPTATTKSFYSSQSGEKYTEYDGSADAMQTFTFTNNTMYNLALGKNFFTHRQANQKWMTYDVKNNIFVNCGKSGQTIKGMNGGQSGTNPTWTIDGNIFNFNGVDTSAAEETGDADEPVQNSVAGVLTFPAVADGNFDGAFVAPDPAAVPAVMPGDPRWTVTVQTTFATIAELKALADKAEFGFTSEALVVAQGKSGNYAYTYIKDETGSTVIFDKDGSKTPAEAVGKKIAKDWVGSVSIYHGLFELVPAAALTLAAGDAQEVEYPVVDFDYVTAEHAAEVVMLSGVTYSFVNEEELTITKGEQQIAALNKFGLNPGFAKKDVEYNIVGAINVYDDKVEFWPIEFVEKPTVDIVVEPAPGTDISEAIAEASKGHFVRNITINLQVADGAAPYTITQSIVAPAGISILGNGATVDASALEGALVTTPAETPEEWITGLDFFMDNVTIKGLSKALFATAGKNRAYEAFSVNNSVIEVAGDVTVFDFTKGSTALIFNVSTSTIYAPKATSKSLYSSQGGQKATELDENATQRFNFLGNTFYNLATGKNFFSHRQSNQKWLTYSAHSNIFVNCGKSGQTIVGMNGGSTGSNPTWSVANNAFNFVTVNEDGSFVSEDTGVKEDNKDADEPIADTYAGSVYFEDAANGNFAIDATCAAVGAGDLRWGTWEPTHYTLAVSEEALQYADITVQPFALEDEVVKVDVKEKNGFQLTELIAKVGAQTKLTVTDNSIIMPPANVAIDATFEKIAADYEIEVPAGTDIAAALDGLIIRNLKLTLAEGGAYTLTKSIEFSGDLDIVGKGATIDASTLETPFISLSATPAVKPIVDSTTDETTGETTETIKSYPIGSINIHDVTVKGLSQQLVKSNNLYLVNSLTVENAVVEIKGAVKKSIFDFSGANGNVIALIVNNSTLYADAETQWANGGFFSNQGGKKHSELGVDTEAEGFEVVTAIMNSTLYNISGGKTTSTLRENSKPFMKYAVKNSIIVNSGKNGQFLKGLNSGQAGNDANWDVDGNLFNFDGAMAKEAVNNAENIKNTVEGVITFADAAAGVFNYTYVKDPRIVEWPAIGDKRWTATAGATAYAINVDETIVNGVVTPSATWSLAEETIKLTVTPAEGYELETLTAKIGQTEIEIAEDNSFLMPAADVTITATFVAVPKLYIIGGPKDWNLADMTELKYNLETQTYELDYAPTATAYFAFADKQFTAEEAAAEGAWDVFNANNRIALGEDNVDAVINGEPAQLKKVNGTIVLKAGTYKISVTKDLKMTITGEVAPEPTEDTYIIAGSSAALLGTEWDGSNEANKLTLNETTGLYEKSYEGVTLTKGTIEFKIVKNGTTWIPDGMGNNHTCEIPADGVYNVKVTFNAANPEKADDYEMVATPATGINAVTVDKLDNAVIYNLQGQRVEKSQAKGGVFIVNGKKVAIK